MYEQDVFFGPLTFRQFIVLIVGLGISYALYTHSAYYPALQIYAIVAAVFIGAISLYVAFAVYKNPKIPTESIKEYFEKKKLIMPVEEYKRMIARKVAEMDSYISMRKEKGLPADKKLAEVYDILKGL